MSKVTDGFEDCGDFISVHPSSRVFFYETARVEKLLAHARALEAMVASHRWVGDHGYEYCPECLADKKDWCRRDCALDKLLE